MEGPEVQLRRRLAEETRGTFDPEVERPRQTPPAPQRVSVICPTTDERALFHPQLYSCFVAQQWPDKELVVVDTGTHPSPFLALQALSDPRVVYRHFRMMATAWTVGLKRNVAACLSSGAILAHFDDDDFYAPCYLDRMVSAMAGADAVTLSSWFVCDACTGLLAEVRPENDGSQESWVLGYGFSHMYRRAACLANPFPHEHFAEDYKFLVGVREARGSRGVRTHSDEEGIVLHMQQGTNLSNSHAHRELPFERAKAMPVAELPGFGELVGTCRGNRLASPFVSVGEAYKMYLRPTPHQREAAMREVLRSLGAAPLLGSCLSWSALDLDVSHTALVSAFVRRRGEVFVELGRAFGAVRRFSDEALLPGDVPRSTPGERVALLHLARLLLRRCPARPSPHRECDGWLRLQLQTLSHIAFATLLTHVSWHFPRVRLEVDFESAGDFEDPGAGQRNLMLRLLAEQGVFLKTG